MMIWMQIAQLLTFQKLLLKRWLIFRCRRRPTHMNSFQKIRLKRLMFQKIVCLLVSEREVIMRLSRISGKIYLLGALRLAQTRRAMLKKREEDQIKSRKTGTVVLYLIQNRISLESQSVKKLMSLSRRELLNHKATRQKQIIIAQLRNRMTKIHLETQQMNLK